MVIEPLSILICLDPADGRLVSRYERTKGGLLDALGRAVVGIVALVEIVERLVRETHLSAAVSEVEGGWKRHS